MAEKKVVKAAKSEKAPKMADPVGASIDAATQELIQTFWTNANNPASHGNHRIHPMVVINILSIYPDIQISHRYHQYPLHILPIASPFADLWFAIHVDSNLLYLHGRSSLAIHPDK